MLREGLLDQQAATWHSRGLHKRAGACRDPTVHMRRAAEILMDTTFQWLTADLRRRYKKALQVGVNVAAVQLEVAHCQVQVTLRAKTKRLGKQDNTPSIPFNDVVSDPAGNESWAS